MNNFDVDKERELIKKVQMYDDKQALKELLRSYRGIISSVVRSSGITKYIDQETAEDLARKELINSIKNKYDPSTAQKPSTYFYNNMALRLKSSVYDQRPGAARQPAKYESLAGQDAIANNFYNVTEGRNATPEESYMYIKNEIGSNNKLLSVDAINRARESQRRELSGDKIVASGNGAEELTVFELMDFNQNTMNYYENELAKEKISSLLEGPQFSRNERRFLRALYEIGIFSKLKKKDSFRQMALDNGLTVYQAQTASKKLSELLKGE